MNTSKSLAFAHWMLWIRSKLVWEYISNVEYRCCSAVYKLFVSNSNSLVCLELSLRVVARLACRV